MIENTNTKQFYPGPILNNTLEITDFLFNEAEQIKITHSKFNEAGILTNVELNYPTDYEVLKVLPSDINASEAALTASTGQVTLKNITVKAGEKLTIYRSSQIIQDRDYPRTGAFPAASHEGALDYLTMQNQEQKDEIDRALKVPVSTEGFSGDLPVPIPSRALKINNDGTGFEMSEFDPDLALVTTEEFKNQAQQAAIEALSSQTAAANSEKSAKSSETIASQKANQVSDIYEQAVPELNNIINNGVATLSNASNALRTTQITNCITEVPQRVKYTLKDGDLNVHKGTVFILPFGTENKSSQYPIGSTFESNFKVVDSSYYAGRFYLFLESLIEINYSSTSGSTLDHLMGYSVKAKARYYINARDCFSGTTIPTTTSTNIMWYDISSNFIKYSTDKGVTWNEGWVTLPVLEVSRGSDALWKKVLNIFNGVGIFGSELWLDKGVKGLIGKDYNTDGTLKNIEFTTPTIVTVSRDLTQKSVPAWYRHQNNTITFSTGFYFDNTVNSTIRIDNGNLEEFCHIATVDIAAGVLSNLRIRKPIRLVDRFDFDNTNMIGKPQISLDDYLPLHCIWLEGSTVSRTAYAELFKVYGTLYGAGDGSTTFKLPDFRNRAIWGSNTFGYLSAGLPNIIGRSLLFPANDGVAPNAFTPTVAQGTLKVYGATDNRGAGTNALGLNASLYNSIYGASTTVQPPAIKVRVYARYK